MRDIDTIIVHCSATPPNIDIGVKEIRDWHVDGNGWSDIGYHYVIRRDGRIGDGRPLGVQGAHAKGHNKTSIGICLVGGVDRDNKPDANFTAEQYISLVMLIKYLKGEFSIGKIIGHRDVSNKACPCFSVQGLLGDTQ